MQRRKRDAKTKALIVIEGLKGKTVADICIEHQVSSEFIGDAGCCKLFLKQKWLSKTNYFDFWVKIKSSCHSITQAFFSNSFFSAFRGFPLSIIVR